MNTNPWHLTTPQCRSTILEILKQMLELTETNEGLKQLNENTVGLCSLVPTYIGRHFRGDDDLSRRVEDIWRMNRDRLFKAWPLYSGNDRYPVPSLSGNDHQHAYTRCRHHFGWTKYGKLRIELLKYMVKRYEELVRVDEMCTQPVLQQTPGGWVEMSVSGKNE